ncbi:MAG: glutamine-hydrolyzing carbamoyl-phosphate synthase small subunit [Alphaproteobacteria bacterium]
MNDSTHTTLSKDQLSNIAQDNHLPISIQKKVNAVLIFPDGSHFFGYGLGVVGKTSGEICFNTSITGYQEILSDPSYCEQIINFTFPHIGNVGINKDDIEAKKIYAKGLIVAELVTNPSSYRAENNLQSWLEKNKITGITGVDTRAITKKIRENGAKTVAIIYQNDISNIDISKISHELQSSSDLNGVELAKIASLNERYQWIDQGTWTQSKNCYESNIKSIYKIVAVDFGAKLNILRSLTMVGFKVEVVGAQASYKEIMALKPDGVFLSNGPGDPAQTAKYASSVIKKILENKIPLFGICLGHQLLALALGAKTIKMPQGHRGANHPVQNLITKKVEITSQNHGFCIDANSLPKNVEVTHISLFDNSIEGIKANDSPAFSVQYHPESSPGPSDSFYLFEQFKEMIRQSKK